MEVYVPVAEPDLLGAPLAPRFTTFDGKRIGILWNHRVHGDRLLAPTFELYHDCVFFLFQTCILDLIY